MAALGRRPTAIIALLGVLVVVSLQTGAAVMFAGTLEPGWHDTLLPVAFLFAALFAGVAVVAVLAVVMRSVFPLGPLITARHLDLLALLLLALGLDQSLLLRGGVPDHAQLGGNRLRPRGAWPAFRGPHAWCHLGDHRLRAGAGAAVLAPAAAPLAGGRCSLVGVLVAAGMWADHFMVIVITLQQDFLPSAAHPYSDRSVGRWRPSSARPGCSCRCCCCCCASCPMISIHGNAPLAWPAARSARSAESEHRIAAGAALGRQRRVRHGDAAWSRRSSACVARSRPARRLLAGAGAEARRQRCACRPRRISARSPWPARCSAAAA